MSCVDAPAVVTDPNLVDTSTASGDATDGHSSGATADDGTSALPSTDPGTSTSPGDPGTSSAGETTTGAVDSTTTADTSGGSVCGDGGAFISGTLADSDARALFAARLDAEGDVLWLDVGPGKSVWDSLLGPDGLFYVLTQDAIVPHLP